MAEAIAGLATAASALQFADIGLRWSKEIHNFLSTVKHAPQEVEHLRGGKTNKHRIQRDGND